MNFERNIPWRNLYVHVPFCASKCGYCAFYSVTAGGAERKAAYLKKLEAELCQTEFPVSVETLYIGGGTPNFLTAAELEQFCRMLRRFVPLAPDAEISMELNPELLTREKMAVIADFCTRISIGIQSFDEAVRAKLMRHCSQAQLERALSLVAETWHGHLNFDLIYGIEGVDWPVFEADLRRCMAAGADHLSCYALTAEENSLLGLERSPGAEDAVAADWWCRIGETLARCGIRRYEVSNYARPGAECRHNRNVWRGGSLLGIGPAAAGFDGTDRFQEVADLDAWLGGAPPEWDKISRARRCAEVFAVNLRSAAGWTRETWEQFAPGSWAWWYAASQRAAQAEPDFWRLEKERIALTDKGLLFWDGIAGEILDWESEES